MITKGIKKLKRPINVQLGIGPGWHNKPKLNVMYQDGTVKSLKVSNKVAEALIANGMNFEG